MLTTLAAEGEIRFDMSPFTRRDFVPAEVAGRAVAALLRAPPGGIVNIGSGVALECGRLALWLIEGRGAGRLVCASPDERDTFALDVGRCVTSPASWWTSPRSAPRALPPVVMPVTAGDLSRALHLRHGVRPTRHGPQLAPWPKPFSA
jgi:hypothetical protein